MPQVGSSFPSFALPPARLIPDSLCSYGISLTLLELLFGCHCAWYEKSSMFMLKVHVAALTGHSDKFIRYQSFLHALELLLVQKQTGQV